MHKYTKIALSAFLVISLLLAGFSSLEVILGTGVLFGTIILVWIVFLISTLFRIGHWYLDDLAKRTSEKYNEYEDDEKKIEEDENADDPRISLN